MIRRRLASGRVRALYDERGKQVKSAGPSIPVQILGFEGVPAAGDIFAVVTDAVEAREIAQKRQRLEREAQNRDVPRGRVIKDEAIYEIAQQQPTTPVKK